MARRKTKVKVEKDHKHVWEVEVEYEQSYCLCPDVCQCQPTAYVHAVCKCGASLDEWEIADRLNGKIPV